MQLSWRQALILILLGSLALSGIQSAHSQPSKQPAPANPPRVISSTPAQREITPAINPIQIEFDQPMDRASVEGATAIEPRVDGKFNWTSDTTLTFAPNTPFKRGQQYTLVIGAGAKSSAGVALEESFRLVFQVTPNPAVSQVVPAPNAQNVEAGATIAVVFDRPMVPLVTTGEQADLPQPLTLSPAVEGKGEWVGTAIYVFRPTKAFAGGTNYTATIKSDLKDVEGSALDKPYSWTFGTVAPQLQAISPQNGQQQVPLDVVIQVTFNQPMDRASTTAAFSVRNAANGANVAGTLIFDNNDQQITFKPTSPLELGTRYQVSVLAAAKSASGNAALTNPTTAVFMTVPYPAVIQTYPADGSKAEPGQGVQITFSAPMDFKSFAGKVHVEPKPENLQLGGGGNFLSIQFQSLPATSYTVTLDAGAADIYGNTIKNPTVIHFTTLDALPGLGLATRDVVAFTNAYRPDTTVIAAAINVSQVDVSLSALELSDFVTLPWEYGYLNLNNFRPPRITRQWTQKLDVKPNTRAELPLKLAGDSGGQLKPGLYYLEVTSPEFRRDGQQPFKTLVVVATANLTIKTSPDETLVWATDLKTGQPVPNAQITLYNRNKQVVASGATDASGLFRAKGLGGRRDPNDLLWAVATGDNVFSVSSNLWTASLEPYQFNVNYDPAPRHDAAYLYTDQPIYRPGHPVYFRGVVRNQDDVTFAVPAGAPVRVIISDPQGKEVYKQTVNLNAYGAFNGKYEPPQDAPIGPYSLRAEYNQRQYYVSFQIAEFRPPEFIVNAKAEAPQVVAGDTIKVNIDSTFFFGGPVSGGKLTWVARANQGYFNYTGNDGYYDFSPSGPYVYNRQVAQGNGTLDDKGHFVIELPADLGGSPVTQDFMIEATVTDISNQAISGRTTVKVHPANLYVGLRPGAYVGQATKPLNVNVIAVDWASKPQANQVINLKVVEKRWEQDPNTLQWNQKDIPVTEDKLTTDDKGRGVFTFTPPRAGIYQVQATTRDSRERIARTDTTVWVQGTEFVPWGRDDKRLTLVADKKSYGPGDTASVLIPSPFPEPVQALVTVERAGIMKTDVVTITGSYTYKLPLEVVHAPNVYIAVALVRGSGDKGVTPEIRYGLLNLSVSVRQQLKIQITPSTSQAKPGDTVKFDVLITDLDGKPVAAEVGLSLSDLANLSVGRANSGPIFAAFWSARPLAIITSAPLSKLIDDLTAKDVRLIQTRRQAAQNQPLAMTASPAGTMVAGVAAPAPGGGAKAANGVAAESGARDGKDQEQPAPTPRTNFVDTPLWLPDLVTGEDGKATASVTLPDNLTTWRLDARAISKNTFVGDTTFDIVSTKPLLVRPSTPRFFVVGDETELATVVNNNTDRDLSVNVSLDAKGVTLKGDPKQTVNVPKSGRTRVTWMATVGDVENVDLSFSAISGEYSDASKPAVGLGDQRLLPVYRYLAPDYVSTAGTLTKPGSRTEAVKLPPATLAPTGELTIKLNPSLAATTLDGLKYLRNYPYQCIEQTVSRFLPNIITFRALQKLKLDKPELRAQLDEAARYALARLKREQHGDGGWGWFPNDESNPLTSTYALLGLVEARAADLPVDPDMFQRASIYVLSTLTPVTDQSQPYELNRIAFTVYVLAKAKSANVPVMNDLFARREKMNIFARAFLAQSYNLAKGDRAKIDTLLSDLQTKAVVSATGTHWEEKYRDWWNWDSDTRTTAIVLQTLVDLTPQSELIPNVVRWLMVARRGDAWETTQETAWAVMALTDWMNVSGELQANYAYTVNVNGKPLGSGQANADTLRDTKTLQIAVNDMLRDQINRIVIEHAEGPGSLYYTASLHVNQPVDSIKPTNRGLGLVRTYYDAKGKPITSAQVGDTITVALEITVPNDLYYVNINDPIPAGAEPVDTSLQTTTQIGQTPELELIDPRGRGWGWWWFSNTELRTEKVVLSATFLPRGSYRFVYQVRASTAGTYRVIPPNGQEFYFPEVFGRGAGSLFTVTP